MCPMHKKQKKHTNKDFPLNRKSPLVQILLVNIFNTGGGLVHPSLESRTEPLAPKWHPTINSEALNTMHNVLVVVDYCEV